MRTRAVPSLLTAFFGLFVVIWVCTTPFGGHPDEKDHYIRVLSLAEGDLVGEPDPNPPVEVTERTCCGPSPTALRWVQLGVRFVVVPEELAPSALDCDDVVSSPVGCEQDLEGDPLLLSAFGTVEPGAYLPAAALVGLTEDPQSGVLLARAGTASVAVALIALSCAVLWRSAPGLTGTVGLVAGLTPAAVYVCASPSPNAWEIAGALAYVSGALSLTAGPRPPRIAWAAVIAGGSALAAGRSLGPVWVLLLGGIALAAGHPRAVLRTVRDHKALSALTAVAVGAAAVSTALWELLVQPKVPFDGEFFLEQLGPSADSVDRVLTAAWGAFGATNEIVLPTRVFVVWAAVVVGLLVLCLARGGRKGVVAGLLTVAAVVAAYFLLAAAVLRQNGFDIQARHLFAVTVVGPVLFGVVASRGRPPGRLLRPALLTAGVLAAVGQLFAWATVSSSYVSTPEGLVSLPGRGWGRWTGVVDAVGPGWVLLAVLATGCGVAALVLAGRTEPAEVLGPDAPRADLSPALR